MTQFITDIYLKRNDMKSWGIQPPVDREEVSIANRWRYCSKRSSSFYSFIFYLKRYGGINERKNNSVNTQQFRMKIPVKKVVPKNVQSICKCYLLRDPLVMWIYFPLFAETFRYSEIFFVSFNSTNNLIRNWTKNWVDPLFCNVLERE